MQDDKKIVEGKLGCSIEEFVEKESEYFEKHKGCESKRKSPFLEFTREDFYYLKKYCMDHNLAIVY
ncbi:MAG: hypothetical protein K6G64_08535 [Eubacterium sp.]|nr:hypothetical protein [Eubacterium sp.]